MSLFTKKLVQVLEDRFQVAPEFSAHLVPLFERFAERRPSPAEWEDVLSRVAAAYHANQESQIPVAAVGEASELIRQFLGEVKKIDESLKVLGSYLQRLRQHLDKPEAARVVH
ncbi:MAG: hypothetical protein GY725_00715 [bacterium]|nr:hypothetical protein [bacterium]